MMTDARIVNDVMTTEDGKYGVFSREGASNRKNGIVVFDASDACHPKAIADYTETVSGGVHSSYVYQGHVFLTDDATGSMRVIDIRDPSNPKEVARWQTDQTEAGRYLHDIMVVDGTRLSRVLERRPDHSRCRQWHEGRHAREARCWSPSSSTISPSTLCPGGPASTVSATAAPTPPGGTGKYVFVG